MHDNYPLMKNYFALNSYSSVRILNVIVIILNSYFPDVYLLSKFKAYNWLLFL